jgi:CubicO group peptidase (beta-lactamase class C family)
VLDLDSDANETLVSWRVPESPYTDRGRVTLRRLLSHSAGLPEGPWDDGQECCYSSAGEAPTITLQQMLDADPSTGLRTPTRVTMTPGSQYRYANMGYAIVQLLVEDTTGQPFADFMQQTVLTPLGMASSTFKQPLPVELRARASSEHSEDGLPFAGKRHHFPMLAAGGLWTTPSDLARFAIAIMRAYSGEPTALLSPDMARQMLTPQVTIKNKSLVTSSGLGFDLSLSAGIRGMMHTGGTWGSTCVLIAFPETGQGAVIMTNARTGTQLWIEIFLSLAMEYGWPLGEE